MDGTTTVTITRMQTTIDGAGDCVLVSLSNGRREEGKPKQDLSVSGGNVHAHTRDP